MAAVADRASRFLSHRFAILSAGAVVAVLGLALLSWQSAAQGQTKEIQQKIIADKIVFEKGGFPSFNFKIDPNTPVADLLPPTPGQIPEVAPLTSDNLMQVPEISFQRFNKDQPQENLQKIAHQVAKIKHLNDKEMDGFLKALLKHRPDMVGLPVIMGDACRMKKDVRHQFAVGLDVLRNSLKIPVPNELPDGKVPADVAAETFWKSYEQQWHNDDSESNPFCHGGIGPGQIAGLMQVLIIDTPAMRLGLVKFLRSVPHVEATRALARLAIFAPEKQIRTAATEALKSRREKDYAPILMTGLRYPLPEIAHRAAEALVTLDRTELVPKLVAMLDEPDPRLPVSRSVGGKEVQEVKQMVRLNHHQNCLVCHPAADSTTPPEAVTAPVPVPGQPLSGFKEGYGQSQPDILVRVDVTYLRQDFSMMMPVLNTAPWPAVQRFDFVARTVPVTAAQAKVFQQQLAPKAGTATPYQDALVLALRGLTGLDAAPTTQAWQQALKQ